MGVCSGVVSVLGAASGATSDCEPPRSLTVLQRDLKEANRSGRLSSSKVKRSAGSMEGGGKEGGGMEGGAGGPDMVQVEAEVVVGGGQEKGDGAEASREKEGGGRGGGGG